MSSSSVLSVLLLACALLASLDTIALTLVYGYYRLFPISLCVNLATLLLSILLIKKHSKLIHLLKQRIAHPQGAKEQSLQAKLSVKQLQLRLLQNQINPHFLYNTLDCIRSQALMYKQPEIAEITDRLSRYFRYCISRNEQIVSLRQEIRNVKDYFYIQRYRFGEKINLSVEIENDDLLDYMIPKTVLQPLVENAIVHGLEPIAESGWISLSVCETENRIHINISDTGVGIPLDKLQEINNRLETLHAPESQSESNAHTSIGLINVNERIRICFGDDYGLHFRSVFGAGTDVQLIIPKVDDVQWLLYDSRRKSIQEYHSESRNLS